jgi:hypothetical protein
MNSLLLNRSAGSGHNHDLQRFLNRCLLRALQPSETRFERGPRNAEAAHVRGLTESRVPPIAHYGGVNAIVIDKFEGK